MSYPSDEILTIAMRQACAEARRYLGATPPNPPVGAAAIDASGQVIAVAAHQKAGQPHAEAALIALCRERKILDQVHTLAVTLEPCNHHGRTPPCTQAILDAGIKRVAIGARDFNPDVSGQGLEFLRARGVEVIDNIAVEECRQLIGVFSAAKLQRHPWVTVKRAFDARGSMIPPAGQKTFSSPPSLLLAHRLRKKCDAILTGSGTILADRPLFTVRHTPDHLGKKRFLAILDRRGRVPRGYLDEANARGFETVIFTSLDEAIDALYRLGVQDILVEAGPELSQAVLQGGSWHLRVDIHCGAQDRVDAILNPAASIPFDHERFRLGDFLPA